MVTEEQKGALLTRRLRAETKNNSEEKGVTQAEKAAEAEAEAGQRAEGPQGRTEGGEQRAGRARVPERAGRRHNITGR